MYIDIVISHYRFFYIIVNIIFLFHRRDDYCIARFFFSCNIFFSYSTLLFCDNDNNYNIKKLINSSYIFEINHLIHRDRYYLLFLS